METISLRAHFDGKQILLDEPLELEPGTELIVMVLPESLETERADWTRLALESLDRAYGDDEPEYSADLIKGLRAQLARFQASVINAFYKN